MGKRSLPISQISASFTKHHQHILICCAIATALSTCTSMYEAWLPVIFCNSLTVLSLCRMRFCFFSRTKIQFQFYAYHVLKFTSLYILGVTYISNNFNMYVNYPYFTLYKARLWSCSSHCSWISSVFSPGEKRAVEKERDAIRAELEAARQTQEERLSSVQLDLTGRISTLTEKEQALSTSVQTLTDRNLHLERQLGETLVNALWDTCPF